ncbi:PREDICTED: uncharacterized protein LOC109169441 [Ipomoea nil]|uniref:uncharacterized protein LOC109169441 n=1 Tax=Ipomoea nil TaxID=35883 RepID=UPI0009014213|nr:PREDICTED: uncharacterized protein LOC109169441 [Ipomoea nil]
MIKKGLGFERGESSNNAPIFVKEGMFKATAVHSFEQGQSSQSVQKNDKRKIYVQTADTDFGKLTRQSHYSRDQRKEKYHNKTITPFTRQVWVRKSEVICYPTIVLIASTTEARWYFDNGCSRHMTGNVKCLMAVQPSSGSVTYGDGQKGKIVGKGTLNVPSLPHLEEVLDMDKLIKLEAVRGVPKILIELEKVCGACAIGKQIRTPHKMISLDTAGCTFLEKKSEAFKAFKTMYRVQKEKKER